MLTSGWNGASDRQFWGAEPEVPREGKAYPLLKLLGRAVCETRAELGSVHWDGAFYKLFFLHRPRDSVREDNFIPTLLGSWLRHPNKRKTNLITRILLVYMENTQGNRKTTWTGLTNHFKYHHQPKRKEDLAGCGGEGEQIMGSYQAKAW